MAPTPRDPGHDGAPPGASGAAPAPQPRGGADTPAQGGAAAPPGDTAEAAELTPPPGAPSPLAPEASVSTVIPHGADPAHVQARRISYFMLFRLAVLVAFTALATAVTLDPAGGLPPLYATFVWTTLAAGYLLTLLLARRLPRVRDLERFAWGQTAMDILFSAVVVQMSGGVLSGFTFLYLVAILGAAVMGTRAQVLAAAGACALIYGVMGLLQLTGLLLPVTSAGELPHVSPGVLWPELLRTLAAMGAVTALSSFLSVQLARSAHQVGNLRALTENILRSLGSGLITTAPSGHVLYANPAACELLGLPDDPVGRPLGALLPGLDALAPQAAPPAARRELLHRRPDGRQVRLGLTLTPLRDERGAEVGRIVNFQDLTRIHELAERVRRSERLAALGELSASVAHEVRNPLAAISASAQLLDRPGLGDEERKICGVMVREAQRLERLVAELLAFTRPAPPTLVPLDLLRAARELRDSFMADPANATMELEISAAPDPVLAMADPAQLSQVLWNLLRNAAEAMGHRGRVQITVAEHGDQATIRVRDHGPGFPPDSLDRVFEPFFTRTPGGTGFGLAVAHRVVEEHGGTITARNVPGGGAEVVIALPRGAAPDG